MAENEGDQKSVDGELADLTRGYLESLRSTVAAVKNARSAGDFIALRSLAHQTRGAAGMYGFPELSETAGLLDDAIAEDQDDDLILELADEFIRGIEATLQGA
jgi:HPt (histidine-containing phosphotransfer) domain-containing protein